jgi:hypothetical protein
MDPKETALKPARTAIAAILFALSGLFSQAHATAFSTDQSDLWFVPNESGWGMQLVQRGATIYATLFVYGSTNAPTWYVASLTPSGGNLSWSGPLFVSTGPWFGTTPFDPSLVHQTNVGTMTWVAQDVSDGLLSYTVNGVSVTKNVTRETIAGDDFSGSYMGGMHLNTTGCSNTSLNALSEQPGGIVVTQTGTAVTVQTAPDSGSACSYSGAAKEFGQMGEVDGSFSCMDGTTGSFTFFEMQVTPSGLTGRLQQTNSNPAGCSSTGWFGGARATVTTFSR